MEMIYDPTGAGDTFAGGFIGYLHKTQDLSAENMKRAVFTEALWLHFCVEKFSTQGLENLQYFRVHDRYREFLNLSQVDEKELIGFSRKPVV